MKRLVIDDKIEGYVTDYVKKMLYVKRQPDGTISKTQKNLNWYITQIQNGTYVAKATSIDGVDVNPKPKQTYIGYLIAIRDRYVELLKVHPGGFNDLQTRVFEPLLTQTDLSIAFEYTVDKGGNRLGTPRKILFHEIVVDAMRYSYVQSSVFPDFIRRLGIKTCVYCNAQYAITTHDGEPLYQLDHCYPKSLYPYLCTSFFNLQPCCGSCNQRKSNTDMRYGDYNVSIWREKDDDVEDYFHFHIEDASLSNYLTERNSDTLELKFLTEENASVDLQSLFDDYKNIFRIEGLYKEHRDVAEELIWKKYAYSDEYIASLKSAFCENFKGLESELPRLLYGNYMNKGDVYKRTLAQLSQDIARQIHLPMDIEG